MKATLVASCSIAVALTERRPRLHRSRKTATKPYPLGPDDLPTDPPIALQHSRERPTARTRLAHCEIWDGTGLCIYAKRLARHRFSRLWEDLALGRPLTLTHSELHLFLEGADIARKLPLSPKEVRI